MAIFKSVLVLYSQSTPLSHQFFEDFKWIVFLLLLRINIQTLSFGK